MKAFIAALVATTAIAWLASPSRAAEPQYRLIQRIKVPDGNFDYGTYDENTGKILMARGDDTTVIDPRTYAVSTLKASGGHMALPIPNSTTLVFPLRPAKIALVDSASDKVIATLPSGKTPDGALYDPFSKLVYVMNHNGGDATIIDPAAKKDVGTIKVGGILEFPVSDGKGKIYVNIESTGTIGVIDVKTRKVTARYKMNDCEDPSGLAYDPDHNYLISACDNETAKVLNAATGKEVVSLKIGGGPDAVVYDERRKLAFIPSGDEGELDVIALDDPAHISVVQQVKTQVGSRTAMLDPKTGRLFLMAFKPVPGAKGGERAPRLPGSFEVLVVGP
jgi:WD40 repeat protein